ncbi:hypothetical protein GOP47_0025366 [Adiantum capillus-veneris]|uniref:Protein kinase domain-containing protein n=1 Tax=Adiantum capillus-veneris TaxID=13818 RepID=A0A9D4Z3I7_ADICA|nr:hypothetical protein GOP47_0025366 [Adiantum capillus-veneris]
MEKRMLKTNEETTSNYYYYYSSVRTLPARLLFAHPTLPTSAHAACLTPFRSSIKIGWWSAKLWNARLGKVESLALGAKSQEDCIRTSGKPLWWLQISQMSWRKAFVKKVMEFWESVKGTLQYVEVDSSAYPRQGYHYSHCDGLRDESEVRGACRRTIFDCVNKAAGKLKFNAIINAASSSKVTRSAVDYAAFVLKKKKLNHSQGQSEDEFEEESSSSDESFEDEEEVESSEEESSEDEEEAASEIEDEEKEEEGVLIPIEIKGIWQLFLKRGRHLCDMFEMGGRERKKIINALSQIYYYMVVEEVQYGALTSKEQHVFFFRTADPNDKTLYVSKTFEAKDKNPTVKQCYLYMLWRAKDGDVVNASQVPITQPSQKWVLPRNIVMFDQALEARGRQGRTSEVRHEAMGRAEAIIDDGRDVALKWLSHLSEFRLESLNLGKVIKRGSTCIVRCGVIDGVDVVVKMFEFFESIKYLPHFKTEIDAYEKLASLQDEIIPQLVCFGTVWGGTVGFIATKREGCSLKGIDPSSLHKLTAALKEIHKHGVLHNDVHLENIVYSEPACRLHTFKIVDFGNSVLFPNRSDLEKEHANFISLLRKEVQRSRKRQRY